MCDGALMKADGDSPCATRIPGRRSAASDHARRLYQEVGIPLYWIVDPDQKLVEVWTPEDQFPKVERERVEWKPEGVNEAFVLDLDELFKPI
jgi:Uma2 family endonuclease